MNNIINYGSQLQMYALFNEVKSYGYDCSIIDYIRNLKIENNICDNATNKIKDIFRKIIFGCGIDQRLAKFEEFQSLIKFTAPITKHELQNGQLEEFDAYICGSDQIWNPEFTGLDPNNYLAFVKNSAKISYAASIGTDVININKEEKSLMAEYIKAIPYVSVREEESRQWINSELGHKAELVVDPTMLISANDWYDLSRPLNKRLANYLVFYKLGSKNTKNLYTIARKIAVKHNLEIINILPSTNDLFALFNKNEKLIYDIGPREFLNLIRNSSWVVTNSYHGTIFSVIFNKPFFCSTLSYGNRSIATRFITLFYILGLEEKIARADYSCINIDVDFNYNNVNKRIIQKRNEARKWLQASLFEITK